MSWSNSYQRGKIKYLFMLSYLHMAEYFYMEKFLHKLKCMHMDTWRIETQTSQP